MHSMPVLGQRWQSFISSLFPFCSSLFHPLLQSFRVASYMPFNFHQAINSGFHVDTTGGDRFCCPLISCAPYGVDYLAGEKPQNLHKKILKVWRSGASDKKLSGFQPIPDFGILVALEFSECWFILVGLLVPVSPSGCLDPSPNDYWKLNFEGCSIIVSGDNRLWGIH